MGSTRIRRTAAVAAVMAVAIALIACASSATPTGKTAMPMAPASNMGGAKVVPAGVETCASCAGKGMAPMVEGTMVDRGGVQTAEIGVKNGYYSPNTFMAVAGKPIDVTFSGKASGCLANPTFKGTGQTVNIEKTGSGTITLGALVPGTYEFSCSMDMVGGKIVVK